MPLLNKPSFAQPGEEEASATPTTTTARPSYSPPPEKPGIFSFLGNVGRGIGNFGIGAAKGIASAPAEFASLGQDVGLRLAAASRPDATYEQLKNAMAEKKSGVASVLSDSQSGIDKTREDFKPEGTAQEIGFGAEKVGEFFVPGLGASKGASVASKVGSLAEKGSMAEKALTLGAKAVTEGTEQLVRSSAQRGNLEGGGTDFAIGAAMPVLGSAFGLAKAKMPAWSKELEKINLRLTPQQKRNFTSKIDDVAEYMSKNKVTGSAEKRLEKVTQKYNEMEPVLDTFLKSPEAVARPVSKSKVIEELNGMKAGYKDRVDTDILEGQIDKIVAQIEKRPGDLVALESLNKLKRSAYDSAYNEAGNKVLDDVMHDVGDVFRKNIEEGAQGLQLNGKDIGEFNKEYGTLINARKFLKTAASRKDVGFLSKLVSSVAGSSLGSFIGGPIGSAVGASIAPGIAEQVAGTGPRSLLSAGLRKLSESKSNPFASTLIKAGEANLNR